MKFIIKEAKVKFFEVTIEAESLEKAKEKYEGGEYDASKDILEDEFLLPSVYVTAISIRDENDNILEDNGFERFIDKL